MPKANGKLDATFWQKLNDDKKLYLQKEISPLMRTRTGEDFKAMSFELKVIHYSIAKLKALEEKNEKEKLLKELKAKIIEEAITEMVSDLPLTVNIVAKEKDPHRRSTAYQLFGKGE